MFPLRDETLRLATDEYVVELFEDGDVHIGLLVLPVRRK